MSDLVTLTCTWSRNPIAATGAPQVNYLLVAAEPSAAAKPTVPVNFCLVLDRSGSMQGPKLASMKAATKRVIEQLNPQDVVSIVIFDDTVDVLVPATLASDRAALLAAVDGIHEQGGTAMSLGMQKGQAELQKHLGPERIAHMLILTDGQTWGDEDVCRSIAEALGQAKVGVTALGLGSEWNEVLLDDLAAKSGGNSDYIAKPEEFDGFFQRTLQAAQGTVAREARLLLRFVREASARAVHRVTPTISNLGYQPIGENEVAVNLGDIVHGAANSVVIDLMLPVRTAGSFRIAQAELHYKPVGSDSDQIVKQDLLLEFSSGATKYDPAIMNLVEKVTAFKLQTRALAEAEAGNTSGATQKLRAAATRLLDLGELELAKTAEQQAEQLEQGGAISAEKQKELRYATRRLTQKLEE